MIVLEIWLFFIWVYYLATMQFFSSGLWYVFPLIIVKDRLAIDDFFCSYCIFLSENLLFSKIEYNSNCCIECLICCCCLITFFFREREKVSWKEKRIIFYQKRNTFFTQNVNMFTSQNVHIQFFFCQSY